MGEGNTPGTNKKLKSVARAIFQKRPDDNELAEYGLTIQDIAEAYGLMFDDEAAEYKIAVWPQTEEALSFFIRVSTQWRTNGHLAIGLDYNTFPMIFDLLEVPPERRRIVFEKVRIMEDAALKELREQHKSK